MIFVIGSGPAGVACAAALLERNCAVTMLDVGIMLEEEKQALLNNNQVDKNSTVSESLKQQQLDSKNPLKLVYNSDFPYAEVTNYFTLKMGKGISCFPSFAKGGLSNAWGAFVEFYQTNQFDGWPISVAALTPSYKKIADLLNPAEVYFAGNTQSNFYYLSKQAKKIFNCWQVHQEALSTAGFSFKHATLAVNISNGSFESCRYCGLCQHGCPISLIYSSALTLNALQKNARFRYIENIIVEQFSESLEHIVIHAVHRLTKEKLSFTGTQVFSACGAIISTALFLKSAQLFNQKITFKDSSHFILPCFMRSQVKNVTAEKLHTLCQLVLKLNNPVIAPNPMHFQLYTYMDYYQKQLKNMLKWSYRLFAPLINFFLGRLVVIQGFVDAKDGHQFTMEMQENGVIKLMPKYNPNVDLIMRRLIKVMKKHSSELGWYPVSWMLKVSNIGKSFHYGGSMPMRLQPDEMETDIFGKPPQFRRLHIVDAAIFPNIAAGSITPTIMANAFRIGKECDLL